MIGPQVFSRMINTHSYQQVFLALGLGAVMVIIGGLAEIVFGVKAERRSLESIRQASDCHLVERLFNRLPRLGELYFLHARLGDEERDLASSEINCHGRPLFA